MKLNPPLLALAAGAFGIGVTEFAPMGLLPAIAGDLRVSIPTAGLLVSAYAIGVMLGAPVMTLATSRVPRRALLIGLMGIFTVGNLMAALSTGYGMLLAARLITSLEPWRLLRRRLGSSRRGWCRRTGAPPPSPPCSWA